MKDGHGPLTRDLSRPRGNGRRTDLRKNERIIGRFGGSTQKRQRRKFVSILPTPIRLIAVLEVYCEATFSHDAPKGLRIMLHGFISWFWYEIDHSIWLLYIRLQSKGLQSNRSSAPQTPLLRLCLLPWKRHMSNYNHYQSMGHEVVERQVSKSVHQFEVAVGVSGGVGRTLIHPAQARLFASTPLDPIWSWCAILK